jgi:hypothetical protein
MENPLQIKVLTHHHSPITDLFRDPGRPAAAPQRLSSGTRFRGRSRRAEFFQAVPLPSEAMLWP